MRHDFLLDGWEHVQGFIRRIRGLDAGTSFRFSEHSGPLSVAVEFSRELEPDALDGFRAGNAGLCFPVEHFKGCESEPCLCGT